MTERDFFIAAVQKDDPVQRRAYLDEACADQPALRKQVEDLLRLYEGAGSFLQEPAAESAATGAFPDTADLLSPETPGTVIGPYKLLQQIGEGGMGTVFMAEQIHPVQRKVALKLIKAGLDNRQVIARFEAERQALAMMDHVNIARVFDAGATDAGRPYFVMELVHGVPITKYCDDNHLTPRQRLDLFVPVCQAIQHAHQKGIIHRDIKPSNVMVTLYDGKPVSKVIDFGVAKATEQKLTERTLFTQYGTMVGTLEYMSPEQAEMSALGVDTRSDIYSLGVLLYELLTGNTPLSHRTMKEAAYAEILRMIKEVEPPKPSTRLSDSGEALASISVNRHTEPAKLTKLMRGELDWIVMKCLEKDRNRRYATANGFAMDVQRYLADEPVLACPPSALYRFRKFARRNKGGLAVAAVVLCFLVLLGSGVGWAVRDRAARQSRTGAQVDLILGEVEQLEKEQKWPEALVAARRAEAAVTGGEADAATAQRVRALLKDLEFVDRLEQIRMLSATSVGGKYNHAGADREYVRAFRDYGVDVEELAVETSIEHLKARPGLAIPLAAALDDWVYVRRLVSKSDAAGWKRLVAVVRGLDPEPLRDRLRSTWGQPVSEVEDELRRLADSIDVRAQHPATLVSLARTLTRPKYADSAIRLLRDARSVYPGDFWLNYELGFALYRRSDLEGAIRFWTAAVSIRPSSAPAHNNLGLALRDRKQLDEAMACFRKASELDPKNATYHIGLGYTLGLQGRMDEAIAAYEEALRLHPNKSYAHYAFGLFLDDIKHDSEGAIACFHKASKLDPKNVQGHIDLGDTLRLHGKPDEAIAAYKEAIRLQPDNAHLHLSIGCILRDKKHDYEGAITCFHKAIELDPKNVQGHIDLGYTLGVQGRMDEALAAYEEAFRLQPNKAYPHHAFGCFLRDIKHDSEGAIACFHKASKLDPKDVQIHYDLGGTLRLFGKPDEAIAAYKEAIRLQPDHANACDSLAACLNGLAWGLATHAEPARRDPRRAMSLAKEAVELKPQDGDYCNTLGAALYRAGDGKAAIAALEKSTELRKGGDSFDWFFLAMAHWQLGEKDKAREWYDRAVQWMDKNQPKNEQLRRFRAEAAELLELKEKKRDG